MLMGLGALAVLLWSRGEVDLLVVLYSISVFLTFSLTLLGLVVYWLRHRERGWWWRVLLSGAGLLITATIFLVMLVARFFDGGWVALLLIALMMLGCTLIAGHYSRVRAQLRQLDEVLGAIPPAGKPVPVEVREGEPAAVLFVSSQRGIGIHTLLNIERLFPGRFRNFVFVSVGEVDTTRIKEDAAIERLQRGVDRLLTHYERFCHAQGLAATSYAAYGTDPVAAAMDVANQVLERFPGSLFFAGTLVFRRENLVTRQLHNYTALALQRRLHLRSVPLIIMPMLVDAPRDRRGRRKRDGAEKDRPGDNVQGPSRGWLR